MAAIAGAVGLLVVGLLWLSWPLTGGQTPSILPAGNATPAATRDAPAAAGAAEAQPAGAETFLESRRTASVTAGWPAIVAIAIASGVRNRRIEQVGGEPT